MMMMNNDATEQNVRLRPARRPVKIHDIHIIVFPLENALVAEKAAWSLLVQS